jgi:hypothetical protein
MTSESRELPGVIATIGLHGSASTWVFNVVREMMIAATGETRVLALYTEDLHELPDPATCARHHVIIKSHQGSATLDAWLGAVHARILLSVRDPRDACLSMSQRFCVPLEQTAQWLARDCNRVMRLAQQSHLLLRYEDQFFEDQVSAQRVANELGLVLARAQIEAIAARYRTEAVRTFALRLADLPPERLLGMGTAQIMDRVTQIHGPHIGDTRIGKWRELPGPVQLGLTRLFNAFLSQFGYEG